MKFIFYLMMVVSVFLASCGGDASSSTSNVKVQKSPPPPANAEPTTQNRQAVLAPTPKNRPAENADMTIQVAGLPAGKTNLIGMVQGNQYLAAAPEADASGTIKIKKDEPFKQGLYFLVFSNNTNMQILIGGDQTFTMKTDLDNLNGAMQVTGSVDNKLLYEAMAFENSMKPRFAALSAKIKNVQPGTAEETALRKEQRDLSKERRAFLEGLFAKHPETFFTSFKRAGQNPELQMVYKSDGVTIDTARQNYLYRTSFWEGVDFQDERLMNTPVISNKLKKYIDKLTVQNVDSIITASTFLVDKTLDAPEYYKYFANWITLHFEPTETTLMDPHKIYVHMIRNYFTRDRAYWSDSMEIFGLRQRTNEMAASLLGNQGPDVVSKDQNGNTKSIYEIDAPYIVIYMYNPECEHCQEESPKLVDFYKEWKSKGVEVFAIAVDTDDTKWKNYIKKTGMTFTNVFDPTNRSIYAKYYVDVTPEIYVLNPDRTIIAKNLKVSQLETVINQDKKKRK